MKLYRSPTHLFKHFVSNLMHQLAFAVITFVAMSCVKEKNDAHKLTAAYDSVQYKIFTNLHKEFEPSGLSRNISTGDVFVVSDHGEVVRLSSAGELLNSWEVKGDLEGVTQIPGRDNYLYILEEDDRVILEFNIDSGVVEREFSIADMLGMRKLHDPEAITYLPAIGSRASSGFLIGFQNKGHMGFLPFSPDGKSTGEPTYGKLYQGKEDLAGLYFDYDTSTLFGIYDDEDMLVLINPETFEIVTDVEVPGKNQEGVLVSGCKLYIAEDEHAVVVVVSLADVLPEGPECLQ